MARGLRVRRFVSLLAVWTLLVCACGSVGLGLFSVHMRRAVHTATVVAEQLLAPSGGLVHYNAVAGRVITAVVVVCACALGAVFLVSLLPCIRAPLRFRAPTVWFAVILAVVAAFTLAATLIADATLSAVVAAMIAARLADFVAGYGGHVTDRVVGRANALADKANPVTNALGITRTVGDTSSSADAAFCPTECFNAARLPFLGSKACICGENLRVLQRGMHHSFTQAVVSTVGAALLAASLTVLFGIVASDAARASLLRRGGKWMEEQAALELGETRGAPLRPALRKKLCFQDDNGPPREAVVEMAPGARHVRALSA